MQTISSGFVNFHAVCAHQDYLNRTILDGVLPEVIMQSIYSVFVNYHAVSALHECLDHIILVPYLYD